MVYLAPLTPTWPADLLVMELLLVIKTCAHIYDLFHTTCAQYTLYYYYECAYVWRSCSALALGTYIVYMYMYVIVA